jgi:hypothetical protein
VPRGKNCFDKQLIKEALEEWASIALCVDRVPEAQDDLSHADVLEEIRSVQALVRRLPEGATWNESL